jgi:hypothetical protein
MVTITKGVDASHNGKVIFQSITANTHAFQVSQCKNLKLSCIAAKQSYDGDQGISVFSSCIRIDYSANIKVYNCSAISNRNGCSVYLQYDTTCTISNNRLEVLVNSVNSEADVIHVNRGDGHSFIGNTFISGKLDATAHPDLLQFGAYGGTSENRKLTTIANNLMLCLNTSCPMMAGINSHNTQPTRWLIYNNIIVERNSGNTGIVLYDGYDESTCNGKSSTFIYNNIIINGGGQNAKLGNLDTLVMKNNIFYLPTSNNENVWYSDRDGFTPIVKTIDYDQYFDNITSDAIIDTGDATGNENSKLSLAQWQVKGYDLHGSKSLPTFVNLWGLNATDYSLTPGSAGIGSGVDLSTFFTTDIIGTIRPS